MYLVSASCVGIACMGEGGLVKIRYMGVACLFLIVGMLTCGLLGLDLRGLRVFGCGVCGLLGSGLGGLRLC